MIGTAIGFALAVFNTLVLWFFGFSWLAFAEGYLIILPMFAAFRWRSQQTWGDPFHDIFLFLTSGTLLGSMISAYEQEKDFNVLITCMMISGAFGFLYLLCWRLMKRRDVKRGRLHHLNTP